MRLDEFLERNNFFSSRTKAKQAILRGEIKVNGVKICKPSYSIEENGNDEITYDCDVKFVSLGGYKLKKALDEFEYSVDNKIAADIGASTGGFTDCLLQNGAKKIYAVDLNDELLSPELKENDKVFPIIKNVKFLKPDDFDFPIDLVVADLSFISATIALPIISGLLDDGKDVILLIKPQFEIGERKKIKNGVVRDKKVIISVCNDVLACARANYLIPQVITDAPRNRDKNLELLVLLRKNGLENQSFKKYFDKIFE